MSQLKLNTEHVTFVESLMVSATEEEKLNYRSYLKALKDGLLDNHRGRYIYICKGKMLNKSFKRAHDVFDHFPAEVNSYSYSESVFIYVPCFVPTEQSNE